MHDGWHDRMGNEWGWGWIPMMLVMILFWGGLVWFGLSLLRRTHQVVQPHPTGPQVSLPTRPTPEETLADRLARGEIDPDDYRARLEALRRGTDT